MRYIQLWSQARARRGKALFSGIDFSLPSIVNRRSIGPLFPNESTMNLDASNVPPHFRRLRKRLRDSIILFLSLIPAIFASSCAPVPPMPPSAKLVPEKVNIGGREVTDEFWWMRTKSDPAVKAYIAAENAYADAVSRPYKRFEEQLYKEMNDHLPDTNETVPFREGDWWYSTRHDDQYPVYVRRFRSPTGDAQIMADVNKLAGDHKFYDYVRGPVSDDGNLLAFSTDVTGNRRYVLQVADLVTGKNRADHINLVQSYVWAADNRTLYYVSEDAAKRAYRLYRHKLGTQQEADALIYEEADAEFALAVTRTRDKKFIVLTSSAAAPRATSA
jgi:oligopeptidase B